MLSLSLVRCRETKQTSADTEPCEMGTGSHKEARVSDASYLKSQPIRFSGSVFICSAIFASPAESEFQINPAPVNTIATYLRRLLTSYFLVCEWRGKVPSNGDNIEGETSGNRGTL